MTTERTTTGVAPAAEAVVPDPPWRTAAAPGWDDVTVICQRRLETSSSRAVSVVQHLASLPVWERKARRVTVKPACRVPKLRSCSLSCSFLNYLVIFKPPARTGGSAR